MSATENNVGRSKGNRGPIVDVKREMLWIEWQTLAREYTDDQMVIGEWFFDIMKNYTEPQRYYHTAEHIYQMILNYKHFYDKITYPRNVVFAIFFHDFVYNPKRKDNEEASIESFLSCAEDLKLDQDVIKEVVTMIRYTASGHFTEEHDEEKPGCRDLHYFLDFDLSILGANKIEYTLYARNIRKEYIHVPEAEFCERRAKILRNFLKRKYIFATDEFRKFAEENARKNVEGECAMLEEKVTYHKTHNPDVHICKEHSATTRSNAASAGTTAQTTVSDKK